MTVKTRARTTGEVAIASLINAGLGSETALTVTSVPNAPETTFTGPGAGTSIVVMGLVSSGTTAVPDSATFAVT